MNETCLGCGGVYPALNGPIHKYMISSAGCWAHYVKLLAYEYANPNVFARSHRLTVDAYALQHPGRADDRRAFKSVRLHYLSLHLIFAYGYSHKQATHNLHALASLEFTPLPQLDLSFNMTAKDINISFQDPEAYHNQILEWAKSAYGAWAALMPYADDLIAARL